MASSDDAQDKKRRKAPETLFLLNQHREGHREAADELFQKHADNVHRIAHKKLGRTNPVRRSMDSMDLSQEALRKAFAGLEGLQVEKEGQFLGWVAKIIDNTIRDAADAQKAQKRDIDRQENMGELSTSILTSLPTRDPNPSEAAMGAEEQAHYEEALDELSALERKTIVLRLRSDKTFPEIARVLGFENEDKARTVFLRAIKRLTTVLTTER